MYGFQKLENERNLRRMVDRCISTKSRKNVHLDLAVNQLLALARLEELGEEV